MMSTAATLSTLRGRLYKGALLAENHEKDKGSSNLSDLNFTMWWIMGLSFCSGQ